MTSPARRRQRVLEHVTDADGVARVATTFTGVRDELE